MTDVVDTNRLIEFIKQLRTKPLQYNDELQRYTAFSDNETSYLLIHILEREAEHLKSFNLCYPQIVREETSVSPRGDTSRTYTRIMPGSRSRGSHSFVATTGSLRSPGGLSGYRREMSGMYGSLPGGIHGGSSRRPRKTPTKARYTRHMTRKSSSPNKGRKEVKNGK